MSATPSLGSEDVMLPDSSSGDHSDTQVMESQYEPQVDWKERCLMLEASLRKFKEQAAKIRQLLSERVSKKTTLFYI